MNLLLKYNQYLKQVFPTQALVSKDTDTKKIKFTLTKDKQINQHYIGGEQSDVSSPLQEKEDTEFELKYIENNNVIILGGMSPDYVSGHNITETIPHKSVIFVSDDIQTDVKNKSKNKDKPKSKNAGEKSKNVDKKSKKSIHVSCLDGESCKNKFIEELKSKYGNDIIDNQNISITFTKIFSVNDGKINLDVPEVDHLFYIPCTDGHNLKSSFIHNDPKIKNKLKTANYFDKEDVKRCKEYNKPKIEKYLSDKKRELNNYHSNIGYVELSPDYKEIHTILLKLV